MKVDLHQHSTYSDGALSPADLIARAARLGLGAVALTDHDTMRGVPEFLAAALGAGIEGIAGVELSAAEDAHTVHVLGYRLSDPDDRLKPFREARIERTDRMIARLNALGVMIHREELDAFGTHAPGRYHVAQLIADKGYARDFEDAFCRYLRPGCPAWVAWAPVRPEDAVREIVALGGIAVLAHPKRVRLDSEALERLVARMAGAGLQGIECEYPTHTSLDAQKYRSLAARYGLFATAGSDFHRDQDSALHGTGEFFGAETDANTARALGLVY